MKYIMSIIQHLILYDIQVNKAYDYIKDKPFSCYDDIEILFSRSTASRRHGEISALLKVFLIMTPLMMMHRGLILLHLPYLLVVYLLLHVSIVMIMIVASQMNHLIAHPQVPQYLKLGYYIIHVHPYQVERGRGQVLGLLRIA